MLRNIKPLSGDKLGPFDVEIDPTRSEQVTSASALSYRRLFEAAMSGLLILQTDTDRMRDLNIFLVERLGFSYGEMVGRPIWGPGPLTKRRHGRALK